MVPSRAYELLKATSAEFTHRQDLLEAGCQVDEDGRPCRAKRAVTLLLRACDAGHRSVTACCGWHAMQMEEDVQSRQMVCATCRAGVATGFVEPTEA